MRELFICNEDTNFSIQGNYSEEELWCVLNQLKAESDFNHRVLIEETIILL